MEDKRWIILCMCLLWHCYSCSATSCQANADCISELFRCELPADTSIESEGNCSQVVCPDAECPQNAVCSDANICQCAAGHTELNRECTKVIGRTCAIDSDCDSNNAVCSSDNECVCNIYHSWDNNGVCESVNGKTCNYSSDCGNDYNMQCANGTCQCAAGTEWKSENNNCEQYLHRVCNDDNECQLDNSYCEGSYTHYDDYGNNYTQPGRCRCVAGAVQMNSICAMVLDSNCAEVNCNFNWGYDGTYCDLNNICKCKHGYKVDERKVCILAAYTGCNETVTCGMDITLTCIDNQCVCADHFQLNVADNAGMTGRWCIPNIGLPCIGTNCAMDNAECKSDGTTADMCVCENGYTEDNGQCAKVIGKPCVWDEQCAFDATLRCGSSGICECKHGYVNVGGECSKVLGSTCGGTADCSAIAHAICNSTKCACPETYAEYKDTCLRPECHVTVPQLPDPYRRSVSYTVGYNEPFVMDSTLKEGWYSIERNSLSSLAQGPQIRQCGTYYPIYIKAELTSAQTQALEADSTINVTATVGGLTNSSEEIEVRIRQCGDNTHVYLKPTSTTMAAYCIDTNVTSKPAINSGAYSTSVYMSLNFTEESVNGSNMFIPNMIAECRQSNGYYAMSADITNYDDGFYYIIDWYINGSHFATYGPSRKKNDLLLLENVILDAGYKLGFKLQCSFKFSDSMFGEWSTPYYSYLVETGVHQSYYTIWNPGADSYPYITYTATPLGCATDVNDTSQNCTMKIDVINEYDVSICNQGSTETDRHHLCGITMLGVTKLGWENMLSLYNGWNGGLYYRDTYENGTQLREEFGTLVQTFADEDHKASNTMKVKFEPSTDTGHRLWKGYTIPDLNVNVQHEYNYLNCKVTANNGQLPTVTQYEGYFTPSSMTDVGVELKINGEYILFRSKVVPVEVQIKTEECDSGVCICATTYRNGNDVYTVDTCGGLYRAGQIYGDEPRITYTGWEYTSFAYLNRMSMSISQPSTTGYGYHGYTLHLYVLLDENTEMFANAEGLCAFTTAKYKNRIGIVSSDKDEFAQSWMILSQESLLNPMNRQFYSWTEEFYMCNCPESTANISEMVVRQQGVSSIHKTVYTGVIKCTLENVCHETHGAEHKEWQPLALPDYSITYVNIRVVPYYNGEDPVLDIVCDFDAKDGFLYQVEWKIENAPIHEIRKSDLLPAIDARGYKLIYAFSDADSIALDVQLVCGVSVYKSDTLEELVPTQYSDSFTPVEIINTEINMIRGGSAVVSLKLHLPLACKRDSECYLDFTVYDPDDNYDCRDSTIAVKSKTTCGERIRGASSQEKFIVGEEMVNIIVTTKNNNKYRLRDTFSLRLKVDVSSSESSWKYTGHLNSTFTVFVRDDAYWQRTNCYANNDPRMRTFDGIYYSNQYIGEFILYRHTKYHAEIQMMTMSCNGGRASCSCGVIIRAGKDVYIINHCKGQHITGFLIADDNALIVRERTQNRYQIVMPHGTTVDVHINPWRWYIVNIYIYPSPADVGNIEGLCGNFNGNNTDDLKHRDGTVTRTGIWWWYYSPDDFSRSWRLADNDSASLIQAQDVLAEILESWGDNEQLCVCPGNHATRDAICSANEADTCTTEIDIPTKRRATAKRDKRSVSFNIDLERRIRKIRDENEITHVVKRSADTNNMTLEEATEICKALLVTCKLFNMSTTNNNSTPGANVNTTIRDCAEDTLLNPEEEWATAACSAMQIYVENEVQRNIVFQEEHPEYLIEIQDQKCIGDCNGHGTCVDAYCPVGPVSIKKMGGRGFMYYGVVFQCGSIIYVTEACVCQDDYDGDECFLKRSKALEISDTTGGGVCDMKIYGDCDCISVDTNDGFVRLPTCHIGIRTADTTLMFSEMKMYVGVVVYQSFNTIQCCLPGHGRKRRSAETEVAQILSLSVSNDGTTFGASATVFVMDTTCQNITIGDTGDYVAVLQAEYCFIEGNCHSNGNKRDNSDCDVCASGTNAFAWTTDTSLDGCTDGSANSVTSSPSSYERDTSIQGYVIGLIVFGGLVLAGLVIGCVVHKCKKSKAVDPDAGLYYTSNGPANRQFNLRKEPPKQAWMTGEI